jgi:phosphosulfolactate synthase (CoM biosynthesis protein A)
MFPVIPAGIKAGLLEESSFHQNEFNASIIEVTSQWLDVCHFAVGAVMLLPTDRYLVGG